LAGDIGCITDRFIIIIAGDMQAYTENPNIVSGRMKEEKGQARKRLEGRV
jgi:hypothetical protein